MNVDGPLEVRFNKSKAKADTKRFLSSSNREGDLEHIQKVCQIVHNNSVAEIEETPVKRLCAAR